MGKLEWNKLYEKYSQELLKVIKFWEDNCLDEKYGGYFTLIDKDGSVYDSIGDLKTFLSN